MSSHFVAEQTPQLMTHFSDADGPRGIAHQVATFQAATHDLPGERSLSNSAAVLRHSLPVRSARFGWTWIWLGSVRLGLAWLGSAWLGTARLGMARLGLAWLGLGLGRLGL